MKFASSERKQNPLTINHEKYRACSISKENRGFTGVFLKNEKNLTTQQKLKFSPHKKETKYS